MPIVTEFSAPADKYSIDLYDRVREKMKEQGAESPAPGQWVRPSAPPALILPFKN